MADTHSDATSVDDGIEPSVWDTFGQSDATEEPDLGESLPDEDPPDAGTSGTTATATPTAASTSAPPTTAPQQTAGEKATDERLNAQCILIDFISNLAELNFNWRASQDNQNSIDTENGACGGGGPYNPYMIAMYGDGEVFSSLINGSEKKSRFLDFTTAQLSSITPVVRLYKVQQLDDGTNLDYLIPFSTHAGWANGLSTSGRVWDANQNSAPIITDQFGPDYTMSSTIRPLLRQIYTGDGYQIPSGTQWSRVQDVYPEFSDVCQTKEGVIGPKELAHPGEEQYNWSIINRFDTNSMVHNKIKELHSQSGDKDNVYTWVKKNAEDLFTPGGRYINDLVRANLQTYLRGEARERQAIKISIPKRLPFFLS